LNDFPDVFVVPVFSPVVPAVFLLVVPAEAGIQPFVKLWKSDRKQSAPLLFYVIPTGFLPSWIPASAGTTGMKQLLCFPSLHHLITHHPSTPALRIYA